MARLFRGEKIHGFNQNKLTEFKKKMKTQNGCKKHASFSGC
jgi:hypothetical protein